MKSLFFDKKNLYYSKEYKCHYYIYINNCRIRTKDINDLLDTIYLNSPEFKNYNKYLNWFEL